MSTKPTARELLELMRDPKDPDDYDDSADELARRVEAVLVLHQPEEHIWKGQRCAADSCSCGEGIYPCATVCALDGEEPTK